MTFPDGRVKEGIFKNNIYQNPVTDLNQANQLKTQEILMRNNFKESTQNNNTRASQDGVFYQERGSKNETTLGFESDINNLTISVVSPDRLNSIQHIEKATLPVNRVKRPDKLNPVNPPKRDVSNSPDNDN